MGNQGCDAIVETVLSQPPGTIQGMEARVHRDTGVPDVVQPPSSDQHLRVNSVDSLSHPLSLARYGLHVSPAPGQFVGHIASDIPSPVDELHVVKRTAGPGNPRGVPTLRSSGRHVGGAADDQRCVTGGPVRQRHGPPPCPTAGRVVPVDMASSDSGRLCQAPVQQRRRKRTGAARSTGGRAECRHLYGTVRSSGTARDRITAHPRCPVKRRSGWKPVRRCWSCVRRPGCHRPGCAGGRATHAGDRTELVYDTQLPRWTA